MAKKQSIFFPNGRRISHELTVFLRNEFNFNIPTLSRLTPQETKIIQRAILLNPSVWDKMPHLKFLNGYSYLLESE